MDYTKIPYFAMFRPAGTVIVRVKMDVPDSCCRPEACPVSDYPRPLHRPSGCEQCSRTRFNSQYSDCDSDIVDRCRPYRSSSARSRYVNVCAAVCLVLLVGGLSPQSTAAPHKRTMDRQRRSTQDNSLWDNPCDYDTSSGSPKQYTPQLAKGVALQARNAYELTEKYKNKFKEQHNFPSFQKLLDEWKGHDWLRNFTWFREEILPREKNLNETMPNEYMDKLMKKIDEILPAMFKGLKMVVAGLYTVTKEGLNDAIVADASLKLNITESMHNVRAVLCLFEELMRARDLEIVPLDVEIPDMKNVDKLSYSLLVYRDTLNYLEYIAQVFQKMHDTDLDKKA